MARDRGIVWIALAACLTCAACQTTALREAKNAYNAGDWSAARDAAERAARGGDPQAHLIAARAITLSLAGSSSPDTLALATAARHLRAAARGWPFADAWTGRELAMSVGDWLHAAGLPELARLYYGAALEAPGKEPAPADLAAAESWAQAGLEAIDRWDSRGKEERDAVREIERPVVRLLDRSGWPYPPALADQAARLAWHRGDPRAAWELAAAGWLRAVAEGDSAGAAILALRVDELIMPEWRASARDPSLVDEVMRAWDIARRAWRGAAH